MNERKGSSEIVGGGFFSLGRELNFTANAATRLLQAHLEPHELTPVNWIILGALSLKGSMSVSDIAHFSHVKPPAASRLLSRMERDGWVSQVTDKNDRRIKHFTATDKAKGVAHLFSLVGTVNSQLTEGFSEAEIDQLRALLERVRQNAQRGTKVVKVGIE